MWVIVSFAGQTECCAAVAAAPESDVAPPVLPPTIHVSPERSTPRLWPRSRNFSARTGTGSDTSVSGRPCKDAWATSTRQALYTPTSWTSWSGSLLRVWASRSWQQKSGWPPQGKRSGDCESLLDFEQHEHEPVVRLICCHPLPSAALRVLRAAIYGLTAFSPWSVRRWAAVRGLAEQRT